MSQNPAVETHNLTVRYGDVIAVDQVDLATTPGEIFGLLGPNGAGKTSVIRALTTIVPIASGTATVAGHPLSDQQAVRANIGVLPESNGYPNAQTALAYLRYYGRLFGLDKQEAEKRAERLLDQMGLGTNTNLIGTFSRGMRQRLGLARALINEPTVLFLDEPTLGLDPAGQADILSQLARVAVEDGTCVILCSHLLDEVERVCDRVAIMNRAELVATGTVDEVIASAAIGGRGRIRVAPEHLQSASNIIDACPAAATMTFDNARPGDIDIHIAADAPHPAQTMLSALLAEHIEPIAFDLQGARLSDAFLAITTNKVPT